MTEKSITGLINKLLDNSSTFVISEGDSNGDVESIFEFMIKGYYFCIEDDYIQQTFSGFVSNENTELYACIEIADALGYTELSGVDSVGDNPTYSGVDFSPSVVANKYCLKIAEREDSLSSWKIPKTYTSSGLTDTSESFKKYSGDRIYGTIDGGLI